MFCFKHFIWMSDFSEIAGMTGIGRATVEALNLNREALIKQRKMLYKYGKHPPEDFS